MQSMQKKHAALEERTHAMELALRQMHTTIAKAQGADDLAPGRKRSLAAAFAAIFVQDKTGSRAKASREKDASAPANSPRSDTDSDKTAVYRTPSTPETPDMPSPVTNAREQKTEGPPLSAAALRHMGFGLMRTIPRNTGVDEPLISYDKRTKMYTASIMECKHQYGQGLQLVEDRRLEVPTMQNAMSLRDEALLDIGARVEKMTGSRARRKWTLRPV